MWPVLGNYGISRWNSSAHYCVDITNSGNVTNPKIISTYSGKVITVNNVCSCTGKTKAYYDSKGNYIGMVTCLTHKSTYGNCVKVLNDNGTTSVYGHLKYNSISVKVGDRVSQGQLLALMGDSGCSTGIHLHFEIRTGSKQSTCIDLRNTAFKTAALASNDTTAPTITDTSVSCVSRAGFNINATLNDNVGVVRGWVVVYGPSGEKQYGITASNGFFYHSIYTKDHGGAGLYTIHLYVYDSAGNSAKVTYDNIDVGGVNTPKISVPKIIYKRDKFRITWEKSSTDSDFYEYWVTIKNITTGSMVFGGASGAAGDVNANYYDFTATSPGEYSIDVYAVPYGNKEARQKYYYTTFKVTDTEMTTPAITLNIQAYFVGDTVNISWKKSSPDSDFYQYWVVIDNKTTNTRLFGDSPGAEGDVNANNYSFVPSAEGIYKIDVYAVPYYNKDVRQKVSTKTIMVTKECIHTYSSKITTPATCTSTGIRTYTCTQCSASYTEAIAKNPSNHVGGTAVKNAKTATCTAKGYTGDTYCLGCGVITIKGAEISAKGHGDSNNDGKCDTCGVAFGEPEKPDTPNTPDAPSGNCNHICHKKGIAHFFYLIARLFWKIFNTNKYCSCGTPHY